MVKRVFQNMVQRVELSRRKIHENSPLGLRRFYLRYADEERTPVERELWAWTAGMLETR
jgi:hypothetical protein